MIPLRKVVLHVRRCRWLNTDNFSIFLQHERLAAECTNYSTEFAVVLKNIDTFLISVRSLEWYYKVNSRALERGCKDHMIGLCNWDQFEHASHWILLLWIISERFSIEESMHSKNLFTFLSNKNGHNKHGTLIAAVRRTKTQDVVKYFDDSLGAVWSGQRGNYGFLRNHINQRLHIVQERTSSELL